MSILRQASRAILAAPVVCLLMAGAAHGQSGTVTFSPDVSHLQLNPGQTQLIQATACLPGHPVKADIYLLADITTSMYPVLEQIKANASTVINALLATSGADIAVGLGCYRDFPYDAKPFSHQVAPTKNVGSLVAGINTWMPAGGGDVSEGQYYALYQIATDPTIGFRPGAKRIVLWFGDSPAHDPICAIFNGFGTPTFPIDEALVVSSLKAAGPGGTTVIAISTPTSQFFPLALDDNPMVDANDYSFFCPLGGSAGQASRVASATEGMATSTDDPPQVVAAILDAVNSLLVKADFECAVTGSIEPFVKAITPPFYNDVILPTNETWQVCVTFDILLEGPPCAKAGQFFDGDIVVSINHMPAATHPLSIEQPQCNPIIGQLVIGPRDLWPMHIPKGGPTDVLLVWPSLLYAVQVENIAPLAIPNIPDLVGTNLFLQVGLIDAQDFPGDPVKTSNGLRVIIGDPGNGFPYGAQSGLHLGLKHAALIGGELAPTCDITP